MNFTFNVTVEIDDNDFDYIINEVKKGKNINKAIRDALDAYEGGIEWSCRDYYWLDLKAEVERRLKN